MVRWLLLALLCYVVYRLFKGAGRRGAEQPREPAAETMVACARCGVFLPVGESLESNGRRYCCQEHLRLDAAGDHSR